MNNVDNCNCDRDKYRLVSELYIKYENDLYNYAKGMLEDSYGAMDIVHTAFVNVLENIHKLEFGDERKVRSLLFTIVKNLCLNEKRSAKMRKYTPEPVANQENNKEEAAYEKAVAGEIKGIIRKIQKVNKNYADVLIYTAIGLKCIEIAKIRGVSPSLIRQWLRRARKLLRDELRKKGYTDDS